MESFILPERAVNSHGRRVLYSCEGRRETEYKRVLSEGVSGREQRVSDSESWRWVGTRALE